MILVVAEIKIEILLSVDILREDPKRPIDILNSEKVITFKANRVPLQPFHYLKDPLGC